MIRISELRKIAGARLRDAEILNASKRYDGAIYLCGYAIELVLKARICRTLKWQGYPSTKTEFQNLQSFRTHDLDVLLHLTGLEETIKTNFLADWSAVAQWNPAARYQPVGTAGESDANLMISASKRLTGRI